MTPHPHLRILALASLRRWPGVRWFVYAREIMRLPVTVRDEPVAVSGEIAA